MTPKSFAQQIVKDLISPEGPSFGRDGTLHFVDWDAKNIYQFNQQGSLSVFVNTGGMPTGSKFHKNGCLYVADGDLGLLSISPDGKIEILASEFGGEKFRGLNDLIIRFNGDVYCTDPRGSNLETPSGKVYIVRQDGRVDLFASGFPFPNGICFSADDQKLYLAVTMTNEILEFELDEKGFEKSRRVFAKLEGGLGPDGMAFGRDGYLYVAHFGKGVVAVINPDGKVINELEVGGKKPTNVAFWEKCLYVTEIEKHQVVKLDVGVDGQLLYGLS